MIPELEHTYPRQTILVTSRAEVKQLGKKIEKDNIMAVSWHTPISSVPSLYGILISKKRFTYKLIKESQVFAVNFMSIENKEQVLECGTRSGEYIDMFEKSKLTKKECDKIDCPYIEESLACLECSVQEEIELGDHVLFIGRILKSEKFKEGRRIFQTRDRNFTTTISTT